MAEARRASPSQIEDPKDSSCSICLEPVEDDAFLDRCFRTTSPLPFSLIIHKHLFWVIIHCKPLCRQVLPPLHRALDQDCCREAAAAVAVHQMPSLQGPLNYKLNVPLYWKWRHYLKRNFWLEIWLRREMQALTQEKDVDIIVHHVLGVIESFMERLVQERLRSSTEDKQGEFRALVADASRPFVQGLAEHFVDELEFFLVSGLNIEAYDKMYIQCLDVMSSGPTSSRAREGDDGAGILDFFCEGLEYTG